MAIANKPPIKQRGVELGSGLYSGSMGFVRFAMKLSTIALISLALYKQLEEDKAKELKKKNEAEKLTEKRGP